ncbi:MSP (Major sperm protein) domain family protein [Acanthocheilonema viteae]|uniref:MSP domain-containing protein n=1 Tax=Acanthocheilonema viteae TaxID=6277 RepID=A0A498SPJ1_ACAVI|nr:unnamed protein product [Acanthocheilonema viteae]
MPDGGARPKITDMPVVVEPSFPMFTPRPLKENLNKQTANLILVNTSPYKLIFKIVPNSANINYSIRPEIDYLAPNGCRLIGISISEAPEPKREHDFTYKVLALNPTECFGISAVQFWDQNQLENNGHLLQEAQFVCLEPEAESSLASSYHSISRRRIDNEPKISLSSKYPKRIRRHTVLFDHAKTLTDPQHSPIYYKKQTISKDIFPEIIQCPCHCANSNQYFWQKAATMRSFFYGFAFAFICSVLLFIRKK